MYLTLLQLPGARWICSYAIWGKSLEILSGFNPFSYPQKEYKRVLQWKICNIKLAWEESIFKIVGAIIDSKICYLVLTKDIQSFL